MKQRMVNTTSFIATKVRNERHQFFELGRAFQPLTINILLYSYETLDYQLNIDLFIALHEYIMNTLAMFTCLEFTFRFVYVGEGW